MQSILGYKNVYLDSLSAYDISVVNERTYIQGLLHSLHAILKDDFWKFEYYFLFSHDSKLIPASASVNRKNKILFWFSDESGSPPHHLKNYYTLIFKSYLKTEEENMFSNPLGYVNEFFEHASQPATKDVDVFFAGNLNANRTGLYYFLFFRRFKFLRFLKLLPKKYFFKLVKVLNINDLSCGRSVFLFSYGFKSGLSYGNYYHHLVRSQYILCPKGFLSNETFRHLESLHAGCILISEEMPPVSIYSGHPFLIYKSYKELDRILTTIERKKDFRTALVQQHKAYYRQYFTIDAIASRIGKICLNHMEVLAK
jgi:hypothetical protein